MTKKIVGMLSSYQGISEQRDWLWRQTPDSFGVWENVQVIASEPQPDFLLMYQFDFPQAKPKKNRSFWQQLRQLQKPQAKELDVASMLRGVPQERIIYLLREPPLEEVLPINKANYEAAKQYCGYISGPDQYAPVPDYMPAIWYVNASFRELNEMPPPEKTKSCSWITSGISRTESHRQRLAFLKLLQENHFDFDLYGRGLPDWAKGYGTLNNKWCGMAPYYYNIAIENYAENDLYVSEKLWDSLLSWCLPIYYGGTAAEKLLPPGSYLKLPSLDEKGFAYLKEVTSSLDAWHQAQDAIAEARQIILHKLNLLTWLSNFVGKVS
jgi:hypothetical protein